VNLAGSANFVSFLVGLVSHLTPRSDGAFSFACHNRAVSWLFVLGTALERSFDCTVSEASDGSAAVLKSRWIHADVVILGLHSIFEGEKPVAAASAVV
jgi:hypothetical protein